ncbi:aromatic acid exporter family protein [Gorillibacterium sp. sgz5001074]|uniref:aromatic acid exporter family protein n=1 Tax=Gorillibacterium sp. sgz5001074 TaxID=3446695 RepID=UPI003F67D856
MGIRVIKTAIAVYIAIAAAKAAGLDYALSAGLLSVIGIDITIKRSLQTMATRFTATVIGLLIASVLFALLGFHLWTISLFILIFYPALARFKLADSIVTSSVIVFHVVDRQEVTLGAVGNEILLLIIGLGTATVINFIYMPRVDHRLVEVRSSVNDLFGSIFLHMARHLKDPSTVWDGKELLEAPDAISEGLQLAKRAAENKLFQTGDVWTPYFEMRRQHFDSVQRMLDLLAQVYQTLPHGEAVAKLFTDLSADVKSDYYAGNVETALLKLEREFKAMPLPVTRAEFEMRSALLQLCLELKTYLYMAKKVKKPLPPEAGRKEEGYGQDFVPGAQK